MSIISGSMTAKCILLERSLLLALPARRTTFAGFPAGWKALHCKQLTESTSLWYVLSKDLTSFKLFIIPTLLSAQNVFLLCWVSWCSLCFTSETRRQYVWTVTCTAPNIAVACEDYQGYDNAAACNRTNESCRWRRVCFSEGRFPLSIREGRLLCLLCIAVGLGASSIHMETDLFTRSHRVSTTSPAGWCLKRLKLPKIRSTIQYKNDVLDLLPSQSEWWLLFATMAGWHGRSCVS